MILKRKNIGIFLRLGMPDTVAMLREQGVRVGPSREFECEFLTFLSSASQVLIYTCTKHELSSGEFYSEYLIFIAGGCGMSPVVFVFWIVPRIVTNAKSSVPVVITKAGFSKVKHILSANYMRGSPCIRAPNKK